MALASAELVTAQLQEQRHHVAFDTYDISVKQLLDMVGSDQIDVAPEYQRQFVWDAEGQSRFIESVFLGIPIPSLFMATNKDSTWELIDGVQRISTLVRFCGDAAQRKTLGLKDVLELEGLDKLDTFNGKKFADLPQSIRLGFVLKPIKVTTLNDKSNLNVRFDLFERLNTGGVRLEPQEIRNCIYRGPFNDFLKDLAKSADFKKVTKVREARQPSGYEELVLRFFAFHDNYKNFDHSVNEFLNDYMNAANSKFDAEKLKRRFNSVFRQLAKHLPKGIIRNRNATPYNLFEAVTVGAALAIQKAPAPKWTRLPALLKDKKLEEMTKGGTNSRKMVKGRIEYVLDKLTA